MEQLVKALDRFTVEISKAVSGPYADIKSGVSWGSLVILAAAIILGYIFSSYFSEFFRERLRRKRQSAYLIGYCQAVARHAKANVNVVASLLDDVKNVYGSKSPSFPSISYFNNISIGERYYFTSEGEADKSYFKPYIATELMRLELIIRNADNEVGALVDRVFFGREAISYTEYSARLNELGRRMKQLHKECAKMELRVVGIEYNRNPLPSGFWIPKKYSFYYINYFILFSLFIILFLLSEEILHAMSILYDKLHPANLLQLLAVVGGAGLFAVLAIDGFFHDRVAAWRLANENNFLEHLEASVKEIDKLLSSDTTGEISSESVGAKPENDFFEHYPPTHVASTRKRFEIKVRQPVTISAKQPSPSRSRKSS